MVAGLLKKASPNTIPATKIYARVGLPAKVEVG